MITEQDTFSKAAQKIKWEKYFHVIRELFPRAKFFGKSEFSPNLAADRSHSTQKQIYSFRRETSALKREGAGYKVIQCLQVCLM